ncbi:hypothetical protein BDQ17DRAFT_1378741 [Cyathus striatus]|nr:hypothetical protein BDQ17DRAFT_1378741 [Cyathus striatus]
MALTLCTNVIASRMADAVLCAAEATMGVFGRGTGPSRRSSFFFSPFYHFFFSWSFACWAECGKCSGVWRDTIPWGWLVRAADQYRGQWQ